MGIEFQPCKMKSSIDLLHNNVHVVNTVHLTLIKISIMLCFLTTIKHKNMFSFNFRILKVKTKYTVIYMFIHNKQINSAIISLKFNSPQQISEI